MSSGHVRKRASPLLPLLGIKILLLGKKNHRPMLQVIDTIYLHTGVRFIIAPSIAELLIKIGQKVLEHDYAEDWLSMAEVAAYARRYKIRWRSSNARAREMAESLFHYVNQVSFDIRGSGVVVKYRSDWNEPKRREEYSILFRQLLPDGSAAC